MVEFWEFAVRIAFAAVCGLVIGIDREIRSKPLGAQAYVLVALASAGLMSLTLNFSLSEAGGDSDIMIDPTRLIQGIVGGIGFLGAGAIMSKDDSARLRGVGSGAAVWGSGAVGIACGLGYFAEAAFMSGLIFVILNVYGYIHASGKNEDQTGGKSKKDV